MLLLLLMVVMVVLLFSMRHGQLSGVTVD